uniref:Zinc finger, CCHC-type n=1 Tax=Tanacetum cinerariifolium TaxID=118510 RepID=A0A6L2LK07_TANCI|nr:zinc finger, CCHC-type [Tanacetum cinerariifolium]
MKYEFVALAAAGKEAEWLKNLLLEISLWVKPIAHISIQCDSVATLAKTYSQMYNGNSRHLGARHSMIRVLITNERTEAHVLQIIPMMCLKPGDKEDEVANFSKIRVRSSGLTFLSFEREVKGLILTPYKAEGPFLLSVEPEAASLPLVGVGLSTSQPPPYTVEDGIRTHNS